MCREGGVSGGRACRESVSERGGGRGRVCVPPGGVLGECVKRY